eukprot:TRINITY_DN1619_c0_g2_i2.p1 TRINITY_DN1619_c0_g2~~TRINITY_DN1619_c0_g2_i2.p1  ORF type:complete len:703 (-),score=164.82 TRINITY_DN1619_c0_g2_i2:9-2117(-)
MDQISFPHVIHMGEYAENIDPDVNYEYELTGVLLHLGESANSGHYISHIKDPINGCWWKCDDQRVTQLHISQVGFTDDEKIERTDTNSATSSNAYMLVYTRKGYGIDIKCTPPRDVLKLVMEENDKFTNIIEERKSNLEYELNKLNQRKSIFNEVYNVIAPSEDDDRYNWISTDWLKEWIQGSERPIDNTKIMCEHRAVNPEKIGNMKRISRVAWGKLHKLHKGGPDLNNTHLCRQCIANKYLGIKDLQKKDELRSDMLKLAKNASNVSGDYWISKLWLNAWKKTEVHNYPELIQDANVDIVCDHGLLSIEDNKMFKISTELWSYIKNEFPQSTEFPSDTNKCLDCHEAYIQKREEEESLKLILNLEKEEFSQVIKKQNFSVSNIAPGKYYLIPSSWVLNWKKYVEGNEPERPGTIDNNLLVGETGLKYDLETDNKFFYSVSEKDWNNLQAKYGGSPTIILEKFPPSTSSSSSSSSSSSLSSSKNNKKEISYIVDPPVSEIEIEKRKQEDFIASKNFVDELLTVSHKNPMEGVRRSDRIAKQSGVKVRTSAKDTVETLKLQIYQETDIPPICMKLYLKDTILDKQNSTLFEYGILPNDVILLEEVPLEDVIATDAYYDKPVKEVSFEGSHLFGNNSKSNNNNNNKVEEVGWNCKFCTALNGDVNSQTCFVCEKSQSEGKRCTKCTYDNPVHNTRCEICDNKL